MEEKLKEEITTLVKQTVKEVVKEVLYDLAKECKDRLDTEELAYCILNVINSDLECIPSDDDIYLSEEELKEKYPNRYC